MRVLAIEVNASGFRSVTFLSLLFLIKSDRSSRSVYQRLGFKPVDGLPI